MYIDLGAYDASEAALQEGVLICDAHPDLIAYMRKKHDLHRYMLDVYLESGDYEKCRSMLTVLDEECVRHGLSDTVQPEVRRFLGSVPR